MEDLTRGPGDDRAPAAFGGLSLGAGRDWRAAVRARRRGLDGTVGRIRQRDRPLAARRYHRPSTHWHDRGRPLTRRARNRLRRGMDDVDLRPRVGAPAQRRVGRVSPAVVYNGRRLHRRVLRIPLLYPLSRIAAHAAPRDENFVDCVGPMWSCSLAWDRCSRRSLFNCAIGQRSAWRCSSCSSRRSCCRSPSEWSGRVCRSCARTPARRS